MENPVLLEFLSLKPGVSQNIAVYALPTARNYIFLISAFLVHSTSFFKCSSSIYYLGHEQWLRLVT